MLFFFSCMQCITGTARSTSTFHYFFSSPSLEKPICVQITLYTVTQNPDNWMSWYSSEERARSLALAWNQLLLSTTLDYERTLTEKVIVSFYQGWHQDSGSRGVDMTYISAKHREKWSLQRAPSWTQLCTGRRGLLITQLLVFNKSCGEVCSKMLLGLPCKKVFWDWKVLLLHRNFVGGGPKWLKFHSIWKRMKEIYCHSNKM